MVYINYISISLEEKIKGATSPLLFQFLPNIITMVVASAGTSLFLAAIKLPSTSAPSDFFLNDLTASF